MRFRFLIFCLYGADFYNRSLLYFRGVVLRSHRSALFFSLLTVAFLNLNFL